MRTGDYCEVEDKILVLQPTAGSHVVWSRGGLAHLQCPRHLPLHVSLLHLLDCWQMSRFLLLRRWVKLKLNMSLERCLAMVNASLVRRTLILVAPWQMIFLRRVKLPETAHWMFCLQIKHNLLVALDDRGKISCHKVTIFHLYIIHLMCIYNYPARARARAVTVQ